MAGTHERQVAVPSNSPQPSAGNARVDFRRVAASAGLSAPKYIDPKNATSDGPLGFCRRTGEPPRFRMPDPIRSGPERRTIDAGTA
jgi:hypothetical protein